MKQSKYSIWFGSFIIVLFVAALLTTTSFADGEKQEKKQKPSAAPNSSLKKEAVKEPDVDYFQEIKNDISDFEASISQKKNDSVFTGIANSLDSLKLSLNTFATKNTLKKAEQIEQAPEYKNMKAQLSKLRTKFNELKDKSEKEKNSETVDPVPADEKTFDDNYPYIKWALLIPGIAAFGLFFFLFSEINRLKRNLTHQVIMDIVNEGISTHKREMDEKYVMIKKARESDDNKGGKGQSAGSLSLLFDTAEWKYLLKMIDEDKEKKRPKDDEVEVVRRPAEEKPTKKLTLQDMYNQAHSRDDQANFRENMLVCSMENSRQILEDKQNLDPVFVPENQGTFLIDENSNQMFLNFKVPESRMEIIRLVFNITGSLPSDKQTVSLPAKVQKTSKGWKLVNKGKMEF